MYNHKEVNSWAMILIRLCIMLLLLSLSRWLLYIFNADNFVELSNKELIRLYFIGFRFDLHTLLIFNIPLIFGYGLPIRLRYNKTYRKIIDITFIFTNSIAIALNLIDVIYFRYLDKRMSSELFTFFTGTDEDQFSLILHFIREGGSFLTSPFCGPFPCRDSGNNDSCPAQFKSCLDNQRR